MKIIFKIILLLIFTSAYSQESPANRLKQHVYALADDSLKGRKAGSVYAQIAADYIAEQLKKTGIAPWDGESYSMPFMNNRYNNLVAIIEGNHPVLKNEYIIVGAHYDHIGYEEGKLGELIIFNGADDNASGTAVIIELAQKLKEIQPRLSRTVVLIAFDAEEIGLYGSNDFANNPPFPINDVKLMFSVDMVGWHQTSGYLQYSGVGTIKKGKQKVLNANLIPEGLNVTTKKFERSLLTATDTYGFARQKRPTLAVSTGMKSPYHKPEDMAHLIDYEGMALVTEHLTNLVHAVSIDENFKPSGRIAPKHRQPGKLTFAITANIGYNYHYYTAGPMDGKPVGSYGIGLSAGTNTSLFAVRPEIFYDFIQAKHPEGRISAHSVTIPLNLLIQTPPDAIAGVAVFAGPYYSYRFDGKIGSEKLDFKNIFKKEEFGLNYGIEIRLTPFRIGITSRHALTNFSREKNTGGAYIRNRAWFASLSYLL